MGKTKEQELTSSGKETSRLLGRQEKGVSKGGLENLQRVDKIGEFQGGGQKKKNPEYRVLLSGIFHSGGGSTPERR